LFEPTSISRVLELSAALKARRATRYFSERAIEDDLLWKLAEAAHRAPTAGNTPYRRVMIVKDQKVIRVLRQVSPGILGEPTAILVIYTDMKLAKENGRLTEECATIDAGAAAENVALEATELGLGSCFTKSYSEVAVKELLAIPADIRTEVMIQLGYPREKQPSPVHRKSEGKITESNRFGNRWVPDAA
jgi:nitroreductase